MLQQQRQRVLVIEPDSTATAQLDLALKRMGVEAWFAPDAETGWRTFAKERPTVVITALDTPRRGGAWFLRRLQTEFMGAIPQVYFWCEAGDIGPDLQALEPEGIIVPPISQAALASIVGATPFFGDTTARQAARLRELYEITSLGGDYLVALDTLVARTALTFGVSDCVLWGPAHEEHWPRTARTRPDAEHEAQLLWRCDLAVTGGSTLLMSDVAGIDGTIIDAPGQSYLAAPIELPGGQEIGALCLVDDGSRRFSTDERDALRVLARRLSVEMSWVAAHTRLVEEHEKLRETSLLDPLLGVWTRSALEQSVNNEITVAQRRNEQLSIAILDVDQLRQINDRYGHVAGDEALAHLARVVRGSLRTQDIIGRFGGDEIAVVLTGTGLDDARDVLEGVIDRVRETPLLHHGLQIGLGVAVGLTCVTGGEETGEQAFGRAVLALRRARRSRQGLVVVDPYGQTSGDLDMMSDLADVGVLPAGSTLGGMYRILHEISRGAMGVVYRGEDLGLARPVAIKVLRPDLAQDEDLVGKFRDEAAMLASLHHPNLVQVYSFGTQGDDVYFVMELVEGEPLSVILRDALDRDDALELDTIGSVVAEIAGALDAMHNVGLIHRDVKPSNILLDRIRERAVLVDVGVAKRREDAVDAAGTPGFAAPESFMDAEETAATDVYGLAATVYMLLTGVAPFGSGDVEKVIQRQLYDRPAAPSRLRPGLSPAVDDVIAKALAPNLHQRYGTASEFARKLSDALEDEERTRPDALAAGSIRTDPPTTPPINSATTSRRLNMPLSTRRTAVPMPVPRAPSGRNMGHTRGAVFRVAYRLLGNRLGSAWIERAVQADPPLAEVMVPQLPPMSWQPVEHLITLLTVSMVNVPRAGGFAMAIGRATMSATFAKLFGADPTTVSTAKVLQAAEAYWSRYHTWGRLSVERADAGECRVTVHNSPGEPMLCAVIEGSFSRIAELTGAKGVKTAHPECVSGHHPECRFHIRWDEAGAGLAAGRGERSRVR